MDNTRSTARRASRTDHACFQGHSRGRSSVPKRPAQDLSASLAVRRTALANCRRGARGREPLGLQGASVCGSWAGHLSPIGSGASWRRHVKRPSNLVAAPRRSRTSGTTYGGARDRSRRREPVARAVLGMDRGDAADSGGEARSRSRMERVVVSYTTQKP
jgi:hypothetical protein